MYLQPPLPPLLYSLLALYNGRLFWHSSGRIRGCIYRTLQWRDLRICFRNWPHCLYWHHHISTDANTVFALNTLSPILKGKIIISFLSIFTLHFHEFTLWKMSAWSRVKSTSRTCENFLNQREASNSSRVLFILLSWYVYPGRIPALFLSSSFFRFLCCPDVCAVISGKSWTPPRDLCQICKIGRFFLPSLPPSK